jgi:small conductance mechanosensitive channel
VRAGAQRLLTAAALVAIAGILSFNYWLSATGIDVPEYTRGRLDAIAADSWRFLALALLKLAGAWIGVVVVTRLLRRGLEKLEAAINRWDGIVDNDRSLEVLFRGLYRASVHTSRLVLVVVAFRLFATPEPLVTGLLTVVRIYLVISVGVLLIRSSIVIVDTLDGLSRRLAQHRGWLAYYDHLRPLVPTFRACLEYALWIGLGSLALLQLERFDVVAVWGPKLIQGIGIVFLSAVVIELGRLEIARRMLARDGADEMTRRRRATMAPLVRTAFTYAVYFGAGVLILASLGFNPLPFLAGAGILGLVIGFGAQSLINDVVSGFFMLFENTYLVGDMVEAGGARGVIEAIEFRTTKIRDSEGRLHIIRNGDVKQVINYSKEFGIAVVPVDIAYHANVRAVFTVLREAAARFHVENPDVLAETEIDGITQFGLSTMTVRTSTRVRPGRQEAMAAALRLSIKEEFDRQASGVERTGLVPAELFAHRAR